VLALLLVTQAAAKQIGNTGSIINIGSGVTRLKPATAAVYTATKGAVDMITSVLAKELAPRKIRVNSINPGLVETEGTHTAGITGSDMEKAFVSQTPLGRAGQPGDIASVAVFLASHDSGWLTVGDRKICLAKQTRQLTRSKDEASWACPPTMCLRS
jgi:3-oxoacyl-[acyl-carrier protein] reductase